MKRKRKNEEKASLPLDPIVSKGLEEINTPEIEILQEALTEVEDSESAKSQIVPSTKDTADLYLEKYIQYWTIHSSNSDPNPKSEYLYKWNGVFWEEIGKMTDSDVKDRLQTSVYIWCVTNYKDIRSKLNYIRDVSTHVSYLLKFYSSKRPLKKFIGLNWQNGMLLFEEKRWLPYHDPKYFATNVIEFQYDPKAPPDSLQLKYMYSALGHSRESMNLVRACFYRVIWPNQYLQTGFYFHGLPGTGKSSFMEAIKALTPGKYVTYSGNQLSNDSFAQGSLIGKSILLIPEVKSLTDRSKALVKAYMGRDSMSGRQMYDQKSTSLSFVPEGLVIGSGNYSLLQVIGLDEPLLSRIFPIPLNVQPTHRSAGIENVFLQKLDSLVNWAMGVHPQVMADQVRVSSDLISQRYQDSILSEFISLNLMFEQGKYTIREKVYDKYVVWSNQRVEQVNKRETLNQGDFYTQLQTILDKVFGISVNVESRPRIPDDKSGFIRPRVIPNILLRENIPSEEVPYLCPKGDNSFESKYHDIDPFYSPTLSADQNYIDTFLTYDELFAQATGGLKLTEVVELYAKDAEEFVKRTRAEKGVSMSSKEFKEYVTPLQSDTSGSLAGPTHSQTPSRYIESNTIFQESLRDIETIIFRNYLQKAGKGLAWDTSMSEDIQKFFRNAHTFLYQLFQNLESVSAYNPKEPYQSWKLFRSRLETLKLIGEINKFLCRIIPRGDEIWTVSIEEAYASSIGEKFWYKARRSSKDGDTPSNKEEKERKYFKYKGTFFPLYYGEKDTTTRLTPEPGNTVSSLPKFAKPIFLKNLSQFLGKGRILEIDMVAAHTTFAAGLLGQEMVPLLFDMLHEETGFWEAQVKETCRKYPTLSSGGVSESIVFKTVKKLLKVRLLLSINGGSPNSKANISSALSGGFHIQLNISSDQLRIILLDIGDTWEPLAQLRQGCTNLMSNQVYILDSPDPFMVSDKHKSLSVLWNSIERTMLALIVEELCCLNVLGRVHVLSLEHDGVLVYDQNNLVSDHWVRETSEKMSALGKLLGLDVPLGIEIKSSLDV